MVMTAIGIQEPRILVVPEGEDHPQWAEVTEFIKALGITLDPWQMLVLRHALRRKDDLWAAFAVAVCAPRQNGKNGILEVRELVGARILGEKLLIHTAHLADTSKEAFRRLDDLIDANEWLSKDVRHIWRTNGHESIEFKDGHRIRFRTRTRGGGRGFSGSPVFFDESMFLPEASVGAILPVISAQPDPQVWYMGSAVDQEIMEDGVVFARVRERALAGADDRLVYMEWSLDAVTPDRVEEDQASDPESWAQTNPALGIRILPSSIEAERAEFDPRTFAVERLGVGDWPPTDRNADSVIPLGDWNDLTDPESLLLDPVYLAFDVSPSRTSAAISAAGLRGDELFHVEIVDHRANTGWVVPRLVELYANHEVEGIICDGFGPAGVLLRDLEDEALPVTALNTTDYGRACGQIYDLVEQRALRHLGTTELRAAIKGAKARPLGEAWAWARKKSSSDITPLVAATLSLSGAAALAGREASWAFA